VEKLMRDDLRQLHDELLADCKGGLPQLFIEYIEANSEDTKEFGLEVIKKAVLSGQLPPDPSEGRNENYDNNCYWTLRNILNDLIEQELIKQDAIPPRSRGGKRSVKAPGDHVRLSVNVVSEVYKTFRVKALQNGTTVTDLINFWISDYISKN
jgi:hypothetical protein